MYPSLMPDLIGIAAGPAESVAIASRAGFVGLDLRYHAVWGAVDERWEETFTKVKGLMRRGGVPDDIVNRIMVKVKTELDLDALEPDAEKLYMYAIQKWGGGNLTKLDSIGGSTSIHAMNMGAAAPKLEKSNVNAPIESNIFRPNG